MEKEPNKLKLSIPTMVRNFSKELYQYVKAGAPVVPKEQYVDRLNTCQNCEHLLRNKRCGLCGCIVEHKAKWGTAACPDNRWDVNESSKIPE
jgi:hypothetical protein